MVGFGPPYLTCPYSCYITSPATIRLSQGWYRDWTMSKTVAFFALGGTDEKKAMNGLSSTLQVNCRERNRAGDSEDCKANPSRPS